MQQRLREMNAGSAAGAPLEAVGVSPVSAVPASGPRTLAEMIPGRESVTASGTCYLIERRLSEFWPDAAALCRRYQQTVRPGGVRAKAARLDATLAALAQQSLDGALYFDIETCGFSGTAVFLVGVMRCTAEEIVFRQYLARHYGEEGAVVAHFAAELDRTHTLLSFNGKSFDWPFVTDRAALHRLSVAARPHVDLLHQARRCWNGIVPNHKLQTLEAVLCNRRRTGDIPGSLIPDAYHDFVRTGRAELMRDILQHNLLDLLTMAELTIFLLADEFPTR